MMNRTFIFVLSCLLSLPVSAETLIPPPSLGQVIRINTQLDSFVGNPIWLLIIRDVDAEENIPYMFNFKHGINNWAAFTHGHHYLITVSRLQFSPYHRKPWDEKKIDNFCNLESMGRIQRGVSMVVRITGHLSPNTATFRCSITKFKEASFTITP